MARNTFTLDGVPLTDPSLRWFVEKGTGFRLIPAKRMANITYPGVDGDTFSPGASYSPGGIVIKMYVEGYDHADFMHNLEFITGLFNQRHKLLELRQDYDVAGTDSRVAEVKFINSASPKMLSTTSCLVEFAAEVPKVFWRSVETITQLIDPVTVNNTPHWMTDFNGGNGPINDAVILIDGGFTNLVIMDYATQNRLNITTDLPSDQFIRIDTKAWTAEKLMGGGWTGSGVNIEHEVFPSKGYGSMLEFEPVIAPILPGGGLALTYGVYVYATGITGTPKVQIRARKSFL